MSIKVYKLMEILGQYPAGADVLFRHRNDGRVPRDLKITEISGDGWDPLGTGDDQPLVSIELDGDE